MDVSCVDPSHALQHVSQTVCSHMMVFFISTKLIAVATQG